MICDLGLWFDLWFAHHCQALIKILLELLAADEINSLELFSWLFNDGEQVVFPNIQLVKLHLCFSRCQRLLWAYLSNADKLSKL